MLKNYLLSLLCSASTPHFSLFQPSFSFSFSASFFFSSLLVSAFLFLFSFPAPPFFFFLFFCFILLSLAPPSFLVDVLPLFFSPKIFFSAPKPFLVQPKTFLLPPKTFFSSVQNLFQFSPKPFFSPKRFCLSPKYFFSSAQKYYFQPKRFCFNPRYFFSSAQKSLPVCGSAPPSFCFFSSCLSFLPLATTYCPFSAQVFSSKPFSTASCLFIWVNLHFLQIWNKI